MSRIHQALLEIQTLDELASEDNWLNRIHALAKLMVTIAYIMAVVSVGKYDITRLIGMSVYPLVTFILGERSIKDALWRLRIVLPLVCAVGVCNPFFDHTEFVIGGITVWGGIISMFTLMGKGILTVLAAYLLIATTTIDSIANALRLLHFPKGFVLQILLIYRYMAVLLKEAGRITQAYALRAPRQKGVHMRAWGSLAGKMLLNSMDRAGEVYDSMCLRGYQGDVLFGRKTKCRGRDWLYLLIWLAVFGLLRFTPLLEQIGRQVL